MAESGWLTLPAGISDLIEKGYGFYYNTAATGVAAAACGTGSVPMIWNPSDSDVRLKIIRIRYGSVSGTVILAHIAYGLFLNCGSQIGTAQPIVSHTLVAAVNAIPGAGRASKIRFAPATVSMTGGPSYFMPNGLSSGGALAAGPLYKLVDDVNGEIIINPGNAFFPFVSNGALALTAAVSVFALELPISTPVY